MNETDAERVDRYLQTPKKQRKTYVLLAFNERFDAELTRAIEVHIKKSYPQFAIAKPKNEKEFSRYFNRFVQLILIEDKFLGIEKNMILIKAIKQKNVSDPIPVVFLTEFSSQLIENYNKHLLAYQEIDNYISYENLPTNQVLSKIAISLDEKKRRRSRRYHVNLNVTFHNLAIEKEIPAKLIDMSIHGATLQAASGIVFQANQQIRINIHIGRYLENKRGEFLKLSAKARRVFMGGNTAAVSWEFLSETQLAILTELLSTLVINDMRLYTSIAAMKK